MKLISVVMFWMPALENALVNNFLNDRYVGIDLVGRHSLELS